MANLMDLLTGPKQQSNVVAAKAEAAKPYFPGLAYAQGIQAADLAGEEQTAAAAQKAAAVQEIGGLIQQGTPDAYIKAAARYAQIDPEGAKTLIPQLMDRSPQLKALLSQGDEAGKLSAQITTGNDPRSLKLLDINAQRAKEKSETAKQSPFQKKADELFAQEFIDWEKGGLSTVNKNLKQLDTVEKLLEAGPNVSGPVVGLLPKVARDVIFPASGKAQDAIQDVVVASLRPILGAQFTAEEGKRVVANTFNERLDEKENLRRLKLLRETIKEQAIAKEQMIKWVREKGSLDGYTGPRPGASSEDVVQGVLQKAGVETKTVNGKIYQKVNGGWSLVK